MKLFDKGTGELLLTSPLQNGMYSLPMLLKIVQAALSSHSNDWKSSKDWREKLVHIAPDGLQLVSVMGRGVPKWIEIS